MREKTGRGRNLAEERAEKHRRRCSERAVKTILALRVFHLQQSDVQKTCIFVAF